MKHFVDIMKDCFHEYGSIPCMVPSADWEVHNQPVWNTLFVFAAEYLYDYYGQLETVRQLYPDLKSYALKNIEECASYGWTWKDGQLADWVAPMGDTMLETIGDSSEGAAICGSVYVYMMLGSMTRLASLVGADEDIEIYRQAIGQIYSAFQKKFYRPEEKMYDTGYWAQVGKRKRYRQTSVLLPMSAGMVPDEVTADVMARLVQDIHEKGDHLDTGCVGTKFILPVLADNGYADLAWTVLMQDTYPGWGYWLQNGADSAWESWELVTRSRDHYFLGTCDEFFYSHLCGIREVKDGCRNVTIKPLFYPGLDYAETRMQTVRGELESAWKRKADGRICLQVKVPYGAVAQIHLPAQTVEIVRGAEGITGQGEGILTAVSGDYMFYIS